MISEHFQRTLSVRIPELLRKSAEDAEECIRIQTAFPRRFKRQ